MDPSNCLLSLSVDILWVSSHKYMESSVSKTKLLIYLLKSIPSPGPLQRNLGMCIHSPGAIVRHLSLTWVPPQPHIQLTTKSNYSISKIYLKPTHSSLHYHSPCPSQATILTCFNSFTTALFMSSPFFF